jgi:hypothetical protein
MTYPLTEIEMPPHAAQEARRAAIAGTRALVHEETFTALVALLVGADVIPAERASGLMLGLATKLEGHAAGHPEWQVHPPELRMQADRLRRKAGEMRGGS